MRNMILAAIGVLTVAGAASAQQPQYQPQYQPTVNYPAVSPGAAAATPVQPASGATVIRGNGGCTNCGTAAPAKSFTMSGVTGGNCAYGAACQSGCGSVKSDLAFHFGSCKQFFAPCGPTLGGHGHGGKCGALGFAQPWGTGFPCPRPYDSYNNH